MRIAHQYKSGEDIVVTAVLSKGDHGSLRWDTTPCPDCEFVSIGDCPSCGGSGVVEAVTMWGLDGPLPSADIDEHSSTDYYRLAALNTEGATCSGD